MFPPWPWKAKTSGDFGPLGSGGLAGLKTMASRFTPSTVQSFTCGAEARATAAPAWQAARTRTRRRVPTHIAILLCGGRGDGAAATAGRLPHPEKPRLQEGIRVSQDRR